MAKGRSISCDYDPTKLGNQYLVYFLFFCFFQSYNFVIFTRSCFLIFVFFLVKSNFLKEGQTVTIKFRVRKQCMPKMLISWNKSGRERHTHRRVHFSVDQWFLTFLKLWHTLLFTRHMSALNDLFFTLFFFSRHLIEYFILHFLGANKLNIKCVFVCILYMYTYNIIAELLCFARVQFWKKI